MHLQVEVRDINPPNGTMVARRTGEVNVTFECSLFETGSQIVTEWRVSDFNGNPSNVDVCCLSPLTSVYDGPPTGDSLITTYRSTLIIDVFIEALDQTTLNCANGLNVYSEFYLFVCRKYFKSCFCFVLSSRVKNNIT